MAKDGKTEDGKISFTLLKKQIGRPNLSRIINNRTAKKNTKDLSFTIDTTTIKRLTRERVVYSMVVIPNFVEDTIRNYNLLYFEKNGIIQQLLIKFVPTPTWEANYKKGIKLSFEGKMIAIPDYNLDKGTSKTTSLGEVAICYQSNPVWLCNCENHRIGDPICTCGKGFRLTTETSIVECEISGDGGSDPTSGGNGFGGSTFNPDYPVFDDQNYINKLKANYFWDAIGDAKRIWVNSHFTTINIYKRLIDYQIEQNWTIASRAYSIWAIEFFQEDPATTWEQFENWFMGTSEGQDGNDISDLNNVLNSLTYQQRSLPSYASFQNNFPKLYWPEYPYYYQTMPASAVYSMVGGNLQSLYNNDPQTYRNACAVRISLALNKLGIIIPNNAITRQGASAGGVPQYYFLQAIGINDFMIKTFGDTTVKLEGTDANDKTKIAALLKGKNGIYVIVNNDGTTSGAGYSGHTDLIKNGYVIGGANTSPKGGVKSIRIWILN